MHVATTRASHLAKQLLALARAEAGGVTEKEAQYFDLRQIGDAAAQEWVPRAIGRNIDLGFVLSNAVISGNPLLMTELLNNLIDNALRYTSPGGSVTVRCGVEAGTAFLSVEDNGIGIPAEARTKVFERFYRLEGTPGEGSGLGLAIVKEVVDRHNGTLSVDSGGDSGTKITAKFPSSHAAPAWHAAPREASGGRAS